MRRDGIAYPHAYLFVTDSLASYQLILGIDWLRHAGMHLVLDDDPAKEMLQLRSVSGRLVEWPLADRIDGKSAGEARGGDRERGGYRLGVELQHLRRTASPPLAPKPR